MKKSRFAIASGEVAPHTLLRLMNWLDQHDALDQLSATISDAIESWLDLQQAQDDDRTGASSLANFAAPLAASAAPSATLQTTLQTALQAASPSASLAASTPSSYATPSSCAAPALQPAAPPSSPARQAAAAPASRPAAPPDPISALAASRLASGRGYFWKALFLPEGTRLRVFMRAEGQAEVIGDELVYDGRSISPNQFLRLFRGIPRNAWEELCIRFPGEKTWRRAKELRRELGIPRRRGSIVP